MSVCLLIYNVKFTSRGTPTLNFFPLGPLSCCFMKTPHIQRINTLSVWFYSMLLAICYAGFVFLHLYVYICINLFYSILSDQRPRFSLDINAMELSCQRKYIGDGKDELRNA